MNKGTTFLIDFDGTCVTHDFPSLGSEIGAAPVLRELVNNGHNLILFTMRGSGELSMKKFGTDGLKEAVDWFKMHKIPLYGIQTNPTQHTWTNSPKAYGQVIIDDTALGIPLTNDDLGNTFVDWIEVRKMLVKRGFIPKSLSEIAQEERDEWNKNHKRCPECGSAELGQTLLAPIHIAGQGYVDNVNKATCSCGWFGMVNELVP